jgi:hypothetical protein
MSATGGGGGAVLSHTSRFGARVPLRDNPLWIPGFEVSQRVQTGGFSPMCIEDQIAELQRRRTALLEKLQDGQNFWEDLESTLSTYRARSVSDLPADLQQAITQKLGELPSESELEVEIAKLDQREAELLPLVERRLRYAMPSVALLLTWVDWKALIALLIPDA